MVTVLHYTPGFLNGGIESRLLDWYRNIDRSKIRFVLIKLNSEDDTPNIHEFVELGGTFYNLPPLGLKTVFGFIRKIREIIRKEHIDVIHVHDLASGYFALKAAKKEKIKVRILHSRTNSFLPGERNVFFKKIFKKIQSRYATKYFACSYGAGVWGIGHKFEKEGVVIKNGIQVENFVFNEKVRNFLRKELNISDKNVIGTLGRLSPQKNLPFLLKVFKEYHDVDNTSVLLVVGDGNRSILEDNEVYRELKNSIVFVGNKKDVYNYYFAMDVFCGASLYEGFGTTAIESQASGLPTILSKGFPEVVKISEFCSLLDFDSQLWVETIKNYKSKRYPEVGLKKVQENGYDAKQVAKYLQDIYEGK